MLEIILLVHWRSKESVVLTWRPLKEGGHNLIFLFMIRKSEMGWPIMFLHRASESYVTPCLAMSQHALSLVKIS